MSELEYYNQNGVQVTSSRFVAGGRTFPLGQITSVALSHTEPKTGCAGLIAAGGILFGVIGIVMVITSFVGDARLGTALTWLVIGAVCAGLGILLQRNARATFAVTIVTAAGEQRTLSSPSRDVPEAVINALNKAIIDRDVR